MLNYDKATESLSSSNKRWKISGKSRKTRNKNSNIFEIVIFCAPRKVEKLQIFTKNWEKLFAIPREKIFYIWFHTILNWKIVQMKFMSFCLLQFLPFSAANISQTRGIVLRFAAFFCVSMLWLGFVFGKIEHGLHNCALETGPGRFQQIKALKRITKLYPCTECKISKNLFVFMFVEHFTFFSLVFLSVYNHFNF